MPDSSPSIPTGLNPRMRLHERMQRCLLGECKGACCLHGVWIDRSERDLILAHADEIAPHLPYTLRDPAVWFDGRSEADPFSRSGEVFHSNVLPDRTHYGGTACVFLREDAKCALQVAAEAARLHHWAWKPFYCILHPLDLDEEGRITLDETADLLAEEGSCLRPVDASIPLLDTFEPEIRYLLGDAPFESGSS